MSAKLRKSGLEIIGDVPWGTHFCQFYQTKEDLIGTLIPFFKAGLENNEFCLLVTSQPLQAEEAKEALRKGIPDLDTYLKKELLEITPYTVYYFNEGVLDPGKVIQSWAEKLDQVLESGYDGLRLAGNTYWLEQKDWDDFIDYEKKVDAYICRSQVISMCQYSICMCSTADIIDVASNHQFALIEREGKLGLIENSGKRDVTEITPDGTIFSANPQACQIFGMIEDEIIRAGREGKVVKDHKLAEDMLRQNEQSVRSEIEKIFSPAMEMTNLELAEIIDTQAIQSLMDDFYMLAHIPIGIIDLKGNILVGVGWQDICTRFHRVHPEACKHCIESDTKLSAGVVPGKFKQYKCKNNMWDIATPIIAGGRHIGNIFLGQFFFEGELLDYELFRSQARLYNFNEEEYIAALEKVPRLNRETVDTIICFHMKLANMLSQQGYNNIKLAQSLAERDVLLEALRESEEKYRNIVETVNEGIWIIDSENRTIYVNNKMAEMLGYNQEEMIGRSDWDFIGESDKAIIKLNWEKRLQGLDESHEFKFIRKDGSPLWMLVNIKTLFDKAGNFAGTMGMLTDITSRKEAERALIQAYNSLEEKVKERTAELKETYKALVENERRLSEAQKMAHIGIWDWDLLTDEMYWSDEMYRIFGHDSQKSGSSYNAVLSQIHPDDRENVDYAVKRAFKGAPFCIDHRIILADGENRIVYTQGEVIFDEKDRPIRMRGTVQDITERKKSEEKIQILVDAVESSDDAIITESLDGIITSWNKGAEQIYGYSAEEILGKNVSIFEPENLKGEIKQFIEKVKQREKIQHYRTLRVKKDGTRINVSVTLSPIFDSSGKLVAISCIARDITERIKAEEALAKIEDARKKEIHHRIKNNLQVISSLLDLQAEKFSCKKIAPTKEVLEAFKESQNRVISMSLIHEELHKGNGKDTLDFSAYLRRLTENLFQTYSLSSKNIRLCVDLEENAFFNMDTAVPLGIIVNELISNSLKHAFIENQKGEIQIRLCREESNIEMNESFFSLKISDNGKGIPENVELENLESLGLQLVTALVDQIDGEIGIKRECGTEFGITFNVKERSESMNQ